MQFDLLKKILVLFVILIVIIALFFVLSDVREDTNQKPTVDISYPLDNSIVKGIVMVEGIADDPDGDNSKIDIYFSLNNTWKKIDEGSSWSYEWSTFDLPNGIYYIRVKAFDGSAYSNVKQIPVRVNNPESLDSDVHHWAVFIAAANFAQSNESKLGNGGLNLAEDMAGYLIENCSYPTSNVFVLFDDGWIREDNGYGEKLMTLQQRPHKYDINYGGATSDTVQTVLSYVTNQANKFEDSEVFIWFFSHGCSDNEEGFFGGKFLKRSAIFLWDDILTDKDLGDMLSGLKSQETCVIVDACFSGGFADKTILNFPELFLFRSGLSQSGRVVITGESKYRKGYASTIYGPLFSLIWFNGIKTGEADGFRPGILNTGRPTRLNFFKDGIVTVEEAFYYARYIIRTDESLLDYNDMEPQINDKYPSAGFFGNNDGLILG